MAEEHGVDLSQVEGHGVGGRIRKKDLVAHLESAPSEKPSRPLHIESPYVPEAAPANGAAGNGDVPATLGGRREEMTPMRKAIAEHMVRSRQTAAHVTTIVEVDFSAVAARRAELKEAYQRRGVPLTYLAFVARAVVEALEEFPILNASVEGEEIVFHDDVNLGIAVALDDGLIVPVIPARTAAVARGPGGRDRRRGRRARASASSTPDEVQGGTFTITNPGQFGAVIATPIINQPQVAILDLEAIVKRPVVVETGGQDAIAIRPMAFLPLSWDHRALDGADAARFLGSVKEQARERGRAMRAIAPPVPSKVPRRLRARGARGDARRAQRRDDGDRRALDPPRARRWAAPGSGTTSATRTASPTRCASRRP